MKLNEITKIKLSTDPNDYGAYVSYRGKLEPIVQIPISKVDTFEKEASGKSGFEKNVKNIMMALKRKEKIPPVLVRRVGLKFQILDGHHRFEAYKRAGLKAMPARIVVKSNIEEN